MKYTQGKYPIIKKTTLAKEIYDFTIFCPEVAQIAQAGQFVNVLADGYTLRRPISICGIDREKGTVRIVFEVRGKGTKEISRLNEGEMLDMLAPLGKGFPLDSYKTAITVGGGIGTPPMTEIAKHFGDNCRSISGFRNAAAVILQDDLKSFGAEAILCTDDGSAGRKGFVTTALKDELEKKKPDVIYACGPNVMIKGVADLAKEYGVECFVSLEERMGCGIGACLVCACRTVKSGEEYYAHVCKDGPVFNAEEVLF